MHQLKVVLRSWQNFRFHCLVVVVDVNNSINFHQSPVWLLRQAAKELILNVVSFNVDWEVFFLRITNIFRSATKSSQSHKNCNHSAFLSSRKVKLLFIILIVYKFLVAGVATWKCENESDETAQLSTDFLSPIIKSLLSVEAFAETIIIRSLHSKI